MATETGRSALDDRPLPWIIALDIAEESEVGQALKSMGGEVAFCVSLNDVRQSDFNFLVCEKTPRVKVYEGLNVLQLCDSQQVGWMTPYSGVEKVLVRTQGERASLFDVTDDARKLGLEPLIKSTMLADLRLSSDYLVFRRPHGFQQGGGSGRGAKFTSLLRERNGSALAGYLTNSGGCEWWLLPHDASQPAMWASTVFDRWKTLYPDSFPPGAAEGDDAWLTLAELRTRDEIRLHVEGTEKLMAAREQELEQLNEDAETVSAAAQEKEKRLLFATGDDLVEAVADALTRLGFDVTDADEVAVANNSAKREDLQVRLSSTEGWISLVEVKGKTRAASTSDLAQLAKAGNFYEARTGHKPDSEWYVVNANKNQPPSSRPVPLGTSPEDVDYYAAEENAAVIDTRELFILLRAVESGAIGQHEAQESLRSARGIYTARRVPS